MGKKSKSKRHAQSVAQSLDGSWSELVKKWESVPKFAGKFSSAGTTTGRLPAHQTATSAMPSAPWQRDVEKMRRYVDHYGMNREKFKDLLDGPKSGSPAEQDYSKLEARVVASLVTPGGSTALPVPKVYTGDKMLGVATMHKSNSVPVFSSEEAVEIAKMRRG